MGLMVDMPDETPFFFDVSLPHFVLGNPERIPKAEIVPSPTLNVFVVKPLKGGRCPSRRVHSVGNRIDCITGKHQSRDLSMPFCNPIHIVAQIECQVSHVEPP